MEDILAKYIDCAVMIIKSNGYSTTGIVRSINKGVVYINSVVNYDDYNNRFIKGSAYILIDSIVEIREYSEDIDYIIQQNGIKLKRIKLNNVFE